MSSLPATGCSRYGSILSKTLVSIPDAIFLHTNRHNTNETPTTTTSEPVVKFIDGSFWFDAGRARTEFTTGPRIADAVFVDCANGGNPGGMGGGFPPAMPRAFLHAATMDALGVSHTDHLVVYGTHQNSMFYRTYVHLKTMGHPPPNCHILDGSLQDWIDQGGPTEDQGTPPTIPPAVLPLSLLMPSSSFQPSYPATDPINVVATEDLKRWIEDDGPNLLVVDARGPSGFQNGRMPGAISLPASELLDPETNLLKPSDELEPILRSLLGTTTNNNNNRKLVSTCGIGVSACVLIAALDVLGKERTAVDASEVYLYDGSWNEWSKHPETNPIVKG